MVISFYSSVFVKKLNLIPKYLAKKSIDQEAFFEELGNDITAHGSVPTAIFAFLKSLQPLPEFEVSNIRICAIQIVEVTCS